MILRTSGIGVSIAFLREAQWGSRGREFDSRHSDQSSSAMKAPVGLLSDGTVCVSRWRSFAPTSSGSFPTAVCPKPYQKKKRVTKVTTVKVP